MNVREALDTLENRGRVNKILKEVPHLKEGPTYWDEKDDEAIAVLAKDRDEWKKRAMSGLEELIALRQEVKQLKRHWEGRAK